MERIFEPLPLIVAAAIGAAIFVFVLTPASTTALPNASDMATRAGQGALVGAAVQVGVRLLGVS